jgi:hypothetical protein
MNQALRSRLNVATGSDPDADLDLVREALIEENTSATARLQESNAEATRLAKELGRRDEAIQTLSKKIDEHVRASAEDAQALTCERENYKAQLQKLEDRSNRISFVGLFVCVPFVLIVLAGICFTRYVRPVGRLTFWWSCAICWSAGLVAWLAIIDWRGSKNGSVSTWRPFQLVHKFKGWLFALFAGPVLCKLIVEAIFWLCRRIF